MDKIRIIWHLKKRLYNFKETTCYVTVKTTPVTPYTLYNTTSCYTVF